ncbi:hypothetical protein DFH09DRAFT_1386125 [Mycena vulgaris]|nr:hypothetical protein DFH09DRAFT_1386125 [Mycena vulgaris]
MDVDTQPSEPHRLQDLWFEDGNLVIQAGNSQFRVYRGILAARSPVFKDMLSFPQPPDSVIVDGCPLVHLPDVEREVTEFLKAIFIPEYFLPFPALTTFDIIVGCLRLSHKYGVDYLRRRALIHLSSRYRTTLAEWESSDYDEEAKSRLPSQIDTWLPPDDFAYHICVIQLVREVDVPWILPIAFYRLSIPFNNLARLIFNGTLYKGISRSLSAEDQESFVRWHSVQTQSATLDILRFLYHPVDPDSGCISPSECLRERLNAMERSREVIQINTSVPLHIWDDDEWETVEENVCHVCFAALKRKHAEARQAFWDKLPSIYDLPPWEELEKMKLAAIGDALV